MYLSVQLTLPFNVVKKKTLGLLHFTISCLSACWRLRYDEDDSTMSSAKRNLSSPLPCFEIMAMNITNRIGYKSKPLPSSAPTENVLDFLLRIRT